MVLPNPSNVIGLMSVTFSSGSGVPTHGAPKGSLYMNVIATTNITRAYINTDGGTTWTPVNTVG